MKTKNLILILFMLTATIGIVSSQTNTTPKKILVVYFSHSGNTRAVALQICKKVDGEIFEIQTVKPYPTNYDAVVEQAKREQKSDYRPELKSRLKNIRQYDLIFLGYPDWWDTYPQAVKVFLSEYDLSGKTIIPFCTHEGSEFGRSITDLKKMCPKSHILQGLAIGGKVSHNSEDKVTDWLKRLRIIK